MPRVAIPTDVRESVLDAAERLMNSNGYKKMTMEAIAREARIGKATIYGYFANKEDVAMCVIRRFQESVKVELERIAAGPKSPDQRLREMLFYLVLASFDKAHQCRRSMDETLAALRHTILQRRYEYNRELARILVSVLRQGSDTGLFEISDPEATARVLITAVSGLNPTNLSPHELGERDEIEMRTKQVVDLALSGLRACKCVEPKVLGTSITLGGRKESRDVG